MNYKTAHKKLLDWYKIHGRHELPWRNTEDLYHIYLSEIMLQQTQVSRVKEEYYPQFLHKFPTLSALAEASQDEVLAAWSGLGYYSRARNLHKCAQLTAPHLPKTKSELLKLPGIGHYTASAVCSFGLSEATAVVDTNIARVIKRLFGLQTPKESELWDSAAVFVNARAPREHNLALMDLGSLICLPKKPKCQECPLTSECIGKENPELYTQSKKTQYESLELFYGICIQDGKIALIESKEKMYKNMLILPNVDPIEKNFLGSFKHSYTKYRLTVNLYYLEEVEEPQGRLCWIDLKELESAPISSLTKKASNIFSKSTQL